MMSLKSETTYGMKIRFGHTHIIYWAMLLSAASLLNELNFLDSRVKVEVRAFLVNVEYLLKDKYYYYLTTINDSHIETKMNRIKLEDLHK